MKTKAYLWALVKRDGWFVGSAQVPLCVFYSRSEAREYAAEVLSVPAKPVKILVRLATPKHR